jgi:hypothetical protein
MVCGAASVAAAVLLTAPTLAHAAGTTYSVGHIREISGGMSGQNAEVEQAVDPSGKYVYEEWIGENWMGFARSSDGGQSFGRAIALRGSAGSWDPALAVSPDGTLYAAFMVTRRTRTYPVVLASFDHGARFSQLTALRPRRSGNWGDRDFIAAGADHSVYVTWDYGPHGGEVTLSCPSGGSCGFRTGDLNVVSQSSSDDGLRFGSISPISPGFPASGADSAPLLVEPNGRIDLLFQKYRVARRKRDALGTARSFFSSSTNGGRSWSAPVEVGGSAGTMSAGEWWIDGAIGIDAGGTLYATWDTQSRRHDIGWLSYSSDHGATWSAPIRVTPDSAKVPHIVEVAGGPAGIAYVAWLTNRRPYGYAEYLRTFSVTQGWLSAPRQISRRFGNPAIWPGDTFGITTISPTDLELSWGSAVRSAHGNSEIFAVPVSVGLPG